MRVSHPLIAFAGCLTMLVGQPAPALAQASRHALGSDTTNWVSASGALRLRGESWSGYGAGEPATADLDDAFGLSRLLLRGELHLRGTFTVVGELKSSLATSRELPGGVRTSDEDQLDVQQLYVEAATRGATTLSARAGRFDLALGRERLVSPSDWTNSRRAFQGGSARLRRGSLEARAFWVRPVSVRSEQANVADSLRQMYGAQIRHAGRSGGAEAYWLRTETHATAPGSAGIDRRHTIGGRLYRQAAPGRFDADVELAGQFGSNSFGPDDVLPTFADLRAWMLASQFGWSLPHDPIRLTAGFDYATGNDAGTSALETFSQLYPLAHAYLGYIDMQARQNVAALSLGAAVRPGWDLSVAVEGFTFRRASADDALYNDDGSIARASGAGQSRHVGEEIDLTVRRPFAGGRLQAQAGASYYFAGPFLAQTGAADNVAWVYVQASVSF